MRLSLVVGGLLTVAAISLAGSGSAHAQAQHANQQQPSKPAAPAPVEVTVAAGDTLTSIATVHNSTYQRLFDANPSVIDPNLIYPGNTLRIPDQSESIASRPLPANSQAVADATDSAAPVRPTPSATAQTTPVSAAPAAASGNVWQQIAQCESGGNWADNTGNGYYGGLQFSLSSWRGVGGSGLPSEASASEQIARAQILQSRSGWGAWPACSAKLGLR